jgi:hypothetical protein
MLGATALSLLVGKKVLDPSHLDEDEFQLANRFASTPGVAELDRLIRRLFVSKPTSMPYENAADLVLELERLHPLTDDDEVSRLKNELDQLRREPRVLLSFVNSATVATGDHPSLQQVLVRIPHACVRLSCWQRGHDQHSCRLDLFDEARQLQLQVPLIDEKITNITMPATMRGRFAWITIAGGSRRRATGLGPCSTRASVTSRGCVAERAARSVPASFRRLIASTADTVSAHVGSMPYTTSEHGAKRLPIASSCLRSKMQKHPPSLLVQPQFRSLVPSSCLHRQSAWGRFAVSSLDARARHSSVVLLSMSHCLSCPRVMLHGSASDPVMLASVQMETTWASIDGLGDGRRDGPSVIARIASPHIPSAIATRNHFLHGRRRRFDRSDRVQVLRPRHSQRDVIPATDRSPLPPFASRAQRLRSRSRSRACHRRRLRRADLFPVAARMST